MITEPAVDFLFFLNCALFLVVVFISIAHCGSLSGTTGEKSDPVIYKRLTGANLGFFFKNYGLLLHILLISVVQGSRSPGVICLRSDYTFVKHFMCAEGDADDCLMPRII